MGELTCPKLRRHGTAVLRSWLRLPADHGHILGEGDEPSIVLARLREAELWPQAMRMLALGLPEREAVWWGCMCVRHTAPALAGPELAAVEAAEAWVRRPDGAGRRAAELAMRAAVFATPGAWCGLGTVWAHRERPRPDLSAGRAIAKAVDEAAVRGGADPAVLRRRRLKFFESGIDIGNGGAGRLPVEASGQAGEDAACRSR